MKRTAIQYLLIVMLGAILSCEKQDSQPVEWLAKVGNRTITPQDFRERSEFTVRPDYCKGKTSNDKGIILNTLIGEKLLALEGEKDTLLTNSKYIRNYVQGVKEQTMRAVLLDTELEDALNVTAAEKTEAFKQATKKLHISYLFSRSQTEIDAWKNEFDRTGDFESLEKKINDGKSPHLKEVVWGENLPSLEAALYTEGVTVGSVVGPVETKVGYYLAKVNDMRHEVILGQGSTDTKLRKVETVLKERKWHRASAGYVYNLMKNKDIQLDQKGFDLLLAYYKPARAVPDTREEYLKIDQEELAKARRKAQHDLRNNLDQPLLTVDNTPWSIGEFIDYTQRRPLMFRAKKIREQEFPHYLKLAIKDLIRDKYLTEKAYKKNLDQHPKVVLEEHRWKDHMLAIGARNYLLKQLGFTGKIKENSFDVVNMLRPQLNLIAGKHSIEINPELFKAVQLTGIPWMALRQGMPFQQVVPPLPVITNDERPDYLTYFSELAAKQ